MKNIKSKLMIATFFISTVALSHKAHTEPVYYSNWNTTENAATSIIVDAMENNTVGSNAKEAADRAIPNCKKAVKKILATSTTQIPIQFRLKAYTTASAYMYYGNCDILVLNKTQNLIENLINE